MPDAASIGASASRYTGDPNLGGGTFGFVKLDVEPIQNLARYTFMYNKAEYDQRQKDAEFAAEELADMTNYDLTTGIPKDRKVLEEKYGKLLDFVKENPGAIDYRNKEMWSKYKAMRADLANDLKGAKIRNVMYAERMKKISDTGDQELKDIMMKELEDEVNQKDIRTPLNYDQQYIVSDLTVPAPSELNFDVTKKDANGVWSREFKLFNNAKAWANAGGFAIGFDKAIYPNTPQGKRELLARKNNLWVNSSEAFNAAINAVDANGKPVYKKEVKSDDGSVKYVIDENKLNTIQRGIYTLAKEYNGYVKGIREDISSGAYKDKFGNGISFGDGALNPADYRDIDITDGISAEELAVLAQYKQWSGDAYKTEYKETDDAIQLRGQSLNYSAEMERLKQQRQKTGDGGSDEKIIQNPAILFGTHVQRVKDYFAKNTDKQSLFVNYAGTDKETRIAVGLEDGESVKYNKDGSIEIGIFDVEKNTWKKIRTETIEKMKQGYIDAVKSGLDPKSSQAEGFQEKAEGGFKSIFGTNMANSIWNGNWGGSNSLKSKTTEWVVDGMILSAEKIKRGAEKNNMSEEEYINSIGAKEK